MWNCHRDKVNDYAKDEVANNYMTHNSKTIKSKSFEYKTKIIISTSNDNNPLDTESLVPLNIWEF